MTHENQRQQAKADVELLRQRRHPAPAKKQGRALARPFASPKSGDPNPVVGKPVTVERVTEPDAEATVKTTTRRSSKDEGEPVVPV